MALTRRKHERQKKNLGRATQCRFLMATTFLTRSRPMGQGKGFQGLKLLESINGSAITPSKTIGVASIGRPPSAIGCLEPLRSLAGLRRARAKMPTMG